MLSADLEARLRALLASAPPEYRVVYLFGSQARGTARRDSDVDLAFWRVSKSGSSLAEQPYDYAAALTLALGREVELVELNRAPADLIHRVLRDGKVLLERSPSERVACEVKARREYLDLLPVLRRYRRARVSP